MKTTEWVVLNEESLWYGGPTRRDNPDPAQSIAEVRRLLLEGHIKDAGYLADTNLTATPRNGIPYQTLGELVFTSRREHDPVKNYLRELDLETGVATVSYECSGGCFDAGLFLLRRAVGMFWLLTR